MASAEPMTGVLGYASSGVQGAEPPMGCQGGEAP